MKRLSDSDSNPPKWDFGLPENPACTPPVEPRCPDCGASVCKHGWCDNWCQADGPCPECFERRCLEEEARLEASWQHNVMGPILGFDQADEPDPVTDPPDFEKREEKNHDLDVAKGRTGRNPAL